MMYHRGHNWLNTGVYLEETLKQVIKQGVKNTVKHMTKNLSKPKKTIGVAQNVTWLMGEKYINGKKVANGGYARGPKTDYCDETKNYQPKDKLISFSNKKYLIRHGIGSLGFVTIFKNDFTIAHVYRKKDKDWVTTRRFSGKLGWRKIKELLFENAIHISDARKKTGAPFKTIHKHIILPMKEFEEKFEPNEQMKKSYASTAKDTVLTSLSSILEGEQSYHMQAGTHSAVLNQVTKAISFGKNSYCGDLPAMSIHAVWCNFDPESKLVNTAQYDIGEPVLYQYEMME